MRRETLIGLAEKLPTCVVGMEACGRRGRGWRDTAKVIGAAL